MTNLSLPAPLGRGNPSAERREAFDAAVKVWCDGILELRGTIDFEIGARE